jgi:FAD/FMN-containing dehydrogenase
MTSIDAGIEQLFRDGFAGTVVTPDDAHYDQARAVWNAAADGTPAVIARCRTVGDVARAVALTRQAGVPLAVRGGGHSLPMSQIHFHQMGGAVGRTGRPSAFSGRDAGYTMNLLSTWSAAADDTLHTTANRALAADLVPHTVGRTYVNFEGEPGAARAAYGDAIYDRLARLKRQYDPANVFRRNQNVLPAR